jgi:6-phosphogluconolactonase (cycloisomerase 2 family)
VALEISEENKKMARTRILTVIRFLSAVALLAASFGLAHGSASASAAPGAVYTLTNAAAGNAVAVFHRAPSGELTPAGTVSTGGLGTGAGLGSQGAVALSGNGRWLFAVNAGSDDVSVMEVYNGGAELALIDREPSGGDMPISLTNHGNLLYVLNGGTPNSITGFWVGKGGTLTPIPGSTRALSGANVGPAQVQFNPAGDVLVVTEKATNMIDTFQVGPDGVAGPANAQPSSGMTPFGFAFDNQGRAFVSEAFGGAANASALSSYNVPSNGWLGTISPSVPTHQTAACWTAVSKDGRYAYTTNAGSGSVSGYAIAPDGSVTLLDPDGRTGDTGAGSSPIDAGFSANGRFLYVLTAASHEIVPFAMHADGSLTALTHVTGLVPGMVGLAVR